MFDISDYISKIDSFEGWCAPLIATAMYELGMYQTLPGNILEIGVHHGKSFIPMAATIKDHEVAVALDVFEDQHLNYDGSGNGNRTMFNNNISKWIGNTNKVMAVKEDSTTVDPNSLLFNNLPYRIISIDGSHTRKATRIDMATADILLNKDDGIIFIDDILNSHWLGVISGYVDFIFSSPDSFKPIAYIPNKLVMSRSRSYDNYKDFLRNKFSANMSKDNVPLFDSLIDIYR